MSTKTAKGRIGERLVSSALEKIEDGVLLNDMTFCNATSGMTHQIDHILVHPHGVFVIETKNYSGTIVYDEGSSAWFREIRGKRNKISSPLLQNKSHVINLRRALHSKFPVVHVVVFAKDNAPYIPDENVIDLKDLALFVDSYPYKRLLGVDEVMAAVSAIKACASETSGREHVENIRYYKQYERQRRAEITFALERGKCPYCGGQILTNGVDYRCSKCKFSFKL